MKIRNIIENFKKANILLATSCLLIVATGSAELFQATQSGTLQATPSAIEQASKSATTQTDQVLNPNSKLEKDLIDTNSVRKVDITGTKFKGIINVKFKDEVTESTRVEVIKSLGSNTKIQRISKYYGIRTLRVPEGTEEMLISALLLNPNVEQAYVPNVAKQTGLVGPINTGPGIGTPSCTPNDTYFCSGQQYNLKQAGAEAGWGLSNLAKGTSNITIAIVDTGVDYNHPDLDNKIWTNTGEIANDGVDNDSNGIVDDIRGYNALWSGTDPRAKEVMDDNGHGTFVAGIATAETNNNNWIAGVNWYAKIMIVKALNVSGAGGAEMTADAIRYAVDEGADVINLSLGQLDATSYEKQILQDAVDHARSNNVIVVAAVADSVTQNCFMGFPAALNGVISVSAIGGKNTAYPNYGCTGNIKDNNTYQQLSTSAPGEHIYSTNLSHAVSLNSGPATSWATPHVSGIAGILLGCNSNSNAVFEALKHGGIDYAPTGWDNKYGYTSAHLFYQYDFLCGGNQF